jgi:predicted SprT family Zn-dependent metalloprotease
MITTVQFKTLDDLYLFYNKELFKGELADCIVNMSRKSGSYGFFSPLRWKTEEGGEEKLVHEISLNPDELDRPFAAWHATLVHEMVHLWQQDCGEPSRTGYHNKQWAKKMEEVGLIPSDTGQPGGKKTGQNMTHYADSGGGFLRVFNRLSEATLEALRLKYLPAYSLRYTPPAAAPGPAGGGGGGMEPGGGAGGGIEVRRVKSSKIKYSCACGNNVWGRPGLKIICGECGEEFSGQ